jgi:hypothetical protein
MISVTQLTRSVGFSGRLLCCLLVIVFAMSVAVPPALGQQLTGAIWTTDAGCGGVDLNIYADKTSVFLNGGPPQHPANAANLPDGSYYVQVTDPSGATLLGTSIGLSSGSGPGTAEPFVVTNGVANCFEIYANVGHGAVADGFTDTPNPGGEYKVWVSTDPSFPNNSTKTDNFKVNPPVNVSISGVKFYDLNLDGVQDNGEPGIDKWEVMAYTFSPTTLYSTDVTHTEGVTDGIFSFDNLTAGTTYGICEVIPAASPVWIPTTATSANLQPPGTVNFGNVCLGAGNGLTLGFWHNKNGQALITGAQLCLLNSLYLVKANGSTYDPVSGCPSPSSTQISSAKTSLASWLTSATATNMANMLSAQLATMELNTTATTQGAVTQDPGADIYIGATTASDCSAAGVTVSLVNPNGFTTITNLMSAANSALGLSGNTTAASAMRTCQGELEKALDNANNNQTFVQPAACEINYSAGDVCTP